MYRAYRPTYIHMAEAESELLRFYRPYAIKSNGRECQQWPRPPRRDSAGVCRLASISKRHANRTTACTLAPGLVGSNPWRGAAPSGKHRCLYRDYWPPAKLPTSMLHAILAARAQLARRLKQLALREAARAFANAQRARALILAGLGVANASQPLIPIVQLHVSAECFDPTLVSERPVLS